MSYSERKVKVSGKTPSVFYKESEAWRTQIKREHYREIKALQRKIMAKLPFRKRNAAERSNSQKPLIGKDEHDSYNEPENGSQPFINEAQIIHNAELEQDQQSDMNTILQNLHLVLDIPPQSGPSEYGFLRCSDQAEEQYIVLMQTFWRRTITQVPESTEQNFQEHLRKLQEDVVHQLERLRPLLQPRGLMGYLVACCRRQTATHLQSLLQRVSSSCSCFHLMDWAHHVSLSYEKFSHPDCQTIYEWDEWETKAKDKLLQNVQKEIKMQLEKILQNHKSQKTCDTEEAYVGLHVDVIQCTAAMPEKAKLIDRELSNQVLQICSQELLTFVKGYNVWQREFLEKQTNMNKPQTILFLKTLKTCKEIRTHIQKEDMEETVAMLDELETFTKDLLVKFVTEDMKQNLKRYFNSHNKRTFPFAALEEYFPCLSFVGDEHKAVMGDVYKVVAHLYFKHLIGTSRRKVKRWSADVGTTVHEDAVQLHSIISARASDVHEYNRLLLHIEAVLATPNTPESMDSMKITMAVIQKECNRQSEDLRLLPDLLLWRGFSRNDVRIVMEALPVPTPMPKSPFWLLFVSCCGCCC